MINKITNWLMFDGTRKYIINLEDGMFASKLNRKIKVSTSYALSLGYLLESIGIITRVKKGRIASLYLTDKGKIVKENMLKIITVLNEASGDSK